MHPHEIIWPDDFVQLAGKIIIDTQIAAKIAAREFGQVDTVVKNRPKYAVSKAAIVLLMILSGEVDRDVGNFFINDPSCCGRAMRGDPSTPAKPNTGSLLECSIDGKFKSAGARGCASFRKGDPI